MIVVIGAGLAGLAAARTAAGAGAKVLLIERESEPGGLCRSIRAGGYTFDMSGHFLHLSDPRMRRWILSLRGVAWAEVERDARVWLRQRMTPYPFQVHLKGHDPAFVARCLYDFARERISEAAGPRKTPPRHFAEWLSRRFGRAMCRAFFFPYNEKMWRVPLDRLGFEWTGWSVPVPRFCDLLAGARGEVRGDIGYNPRFLYPRRGGIGAFARALARPLAANLRTGTEVVRLDLREKVVVTAGKEAIPFRAAVAAIPLPALAALSAGLPRDAREAASRLRWVRVLSVNLGVRRPARTPGHWVYVPERPYPFFRVGFLSNVCSAAAPKGCASLFTERSFLPGEPIDPEAEVEAALRGLRRMGILGPRSRVEEARALLLDPAYVLFDAERAGAVSTLRRAFERGGVFPAGRYGSWDYFGMERSMADGIRAARAALAFDGRGA